MNTMHKEGKNTMASSDHKSLPEIVKLSRRLRCNEEEYFLWYPGCPSVEDIQEALSRCKGTFIVFRTIAGLGVRRLSDEVKPVND